MEKINVTKDIYESIQGKSRHIAEKVREFEQFEQDFKVQFLPLHNVGFTVHNKLASIEHIFNQAGVQLFYDNEHEPAVVSEAVICDLLFYLTKTLFILRLIVNEVNAEVGYDNPNPIKNAIRHARTARKFQNEQPILNEKQIDSINEKISDINKLDEEAGNYTLENNLLSTLLWYIDTSVYSEEPDMLDFIDRECSTPLKKLGQESTLQKLYEVYKKRQQLDPIDQENIGVICTKEQQMKMLEECILGLYDAISEFELPDFQKKYEKAFNKILTGGYTEEEYPIMIAELERLFISVSEDLEQEEVFRQMFQALTETREGLVIKPVK